MRSALSLQADGRTKINAQPTLEVAEELIRTNAKLSNPPNLIPLCTSISAEFLTPSSIYLKLSSQ